MASYTERTVQALQGAQRFSRAVEGLIIDNVSAISPWISPLIPASMTYSNMVKTMGFEPWVALAGALTVELVGLSAINTAFTFFDFNQTRRKIDSNAPVWAAVLTAGFYMSVVLTVNVLMDQAPIIVKVAKALLSSLSICGGIIISLRAGHARRLSAIETDRQERREMRKHAVNLVTGNLPELSDTVPQVTDNLPKVTETHLDWRNLPIADKQRMRGWSAKQIEQEYHVEERTARNWSAKANNGYNQTGAK